MKLTLFKSKAALCYNKYKVIKKNNKCLLIISRIKYCSNVIIITIIYCVIGAIGVVRFFIIKVCK